MLKGDLSSFSLGEILQSLAINNHTGTLKISSDRQQEKLIFFSQGEICLLSHGSAEGLRIGEVLIRMGKISAEDLKEALDEQRRIKEPLGKILIGKGKASEEDIREALRTKIREEIYDLFLWKSGGFEFHMGACPSELFDELQKSVRVSINTNSVIMEGLRRLDEWTVLSRKFKTLDEIYIRTGAQAQGLESVEAEVLSQINGKHSVQEQFANFYGTRFEFCKLLSDLEEEGLIRRLTPQECIREANESVARRLWPQALTFLRFATQLQAQEPGLFHSLADVLINLDRQKEARPALLQAVRLYSDQGNLKGAAAAGDKIALEGDFDERDLELLYQAFLQGGNIKKAVGTGTQLVAVLHRKEEFLRAAHILEKLGELDPEDLNLKLQAADFLEKAGEREKARGYLDGVAEVLEEKKKFRELLKVLRLLLAIDPERPRLKEKIAAVQLLLEKQERNKKRRITIAGAAITLTLLFSIVPILYEIKAREYFSYAQRIEQISLISNDFERARKAYGEFIDKYGLSTRVAEAEQSVEKLQSMEQTLTDEQRRVEATRREARLKTVQEMKVAIDATLTEAREAEDKGDLERAHSIYRGILAQYGGFEASRKIDLPLRITSNPAGATVVINGSLTGKTPFIYRYLPGATIEVTVARANCEPVRRTLELRDQWEVPFVLSRRPILEFTAAATVQQPFARAAGLLVFPSRDGKLYAVAPKRREIVWERVVGRFGDRISDLGVSGDEVYLGTVGGEVTAVAAASGEFRWVAKVESSVLAAPAVSLDRKRVAVATASGAVHVLSNSSGERLAGFVTENEVLAAPLFLQNFLVAGSTDNYLYVFDLASGGLKSIRELPDDVLSIAAARDDLIIALTRDGSVHGCPLHGTNLLWSRTLDLAASTPLVPNVGGVSVGTASGQILTLNPTNGEVVGRLEAGQAAVGGFSYHGQASFIGLANGQLVGVDLSTSKVAWRCSIQSPLLAPPVILDGVCYVGTLSGKVLAYEVPE